MNEIKELEKIEKEINNLLLKSLNEYFKEYHLIFDNCQINVFIDDYNDDEEDFVIKYSIMSEFSTISKLDIEYNDDYKLYKIFKEVLDFIEFDFSKILKKQIPEFYNASFKKTFNVFNNSEDGIIIEYIGGDFISCELNIAVIL